MVVGKRDDLPIVQMINGQGRVVPEGGQFAQLWVKDADPHIISDLDQRGLLYFEEPFEHSYPHCWRCKTPLLYFARKDWYIRTSQIHAELQASNEETNWQPPTIKYGRFGDWLANNVDWSLSRDRYWGTPLPIWRCEEGHTVCVGSFAELAELSGEDLSDFDPHRPYVDRHHVRLPRMLGNPSTRVKFVIDAWFDSGSMPFGQWHYPFENEEIFEKRFPADFISEAIDQTRGLVLLVARGGDLDPRAQLVSQRRMSGAHRRRQRPEDVEVARQRARPMVGTRRARRRRAALVPPHRWDSVVSSTSRPRDHRGSVAEAPAHAVEHVLVLGHLRIAGRFRSEHGRHPGRAALGDGPVDPCRAERHHAGDNRVTR